jgi:hypothetical protein
MVQPSDQVYAKYPKRINQYKAPPPGGAITEHFNRTIPGADFICGYVIEVVGPHPADFAERMVVARDLWGMELRREMQDYNYFAGFGMVGEAMPQLRNEVRLHHTDRDAFGLPVAHVIFSYHENDKRLIAHADAMTSRIHQAAGASDAWRAPRTAHLMGSCRMGSDARCSIVNADCRTHDIPNLFICDGSVFPTSTAVNPSLTISALAARTVDRIRASARLGAVHT